MREGTATANGVEFIYLHDGPPDGPLALCLHGFPDSAPTWRHLLPALADAGYHAVAPWLRGYAPTAVPDDGCYQTGALVADATALHDVLGGDGDAVVIGHDWGATAAYGAACYQPQRWRRVVAMAVPPPAAMSADLFTYEQTRRSFYIFFFQTPLAEAAVAANDMVFLERLWANWSPGYDGAEDVANVKRSLTRPENLAAAIGYYRAMFDPSLHQPSYADAQLAAGGTPSQPTLYLHGADDGCLGVEILGDVAGVLAAGSAVEIVAGAGHFLHLDRPDEVNKAVLSFVGS